MREGSDLVISGGMRPAELYGQARYFVRSERDSIRRCLYQKNEEKTNQGFAQGSGGALISLGAYGPLDVDDAQRWENLPMGNGNTAVPSSPVTSTRKLLAFATRLQPEMHEFWIGRGLGSTVTFGCPRPWRGSG